MVLRFKSVKIENFLSIEKAEVNLDREGYILVSGVNENPDDSAKSNGAGKSTVFESIVFCLTGDTMRGTKDVKRYNSDSACSVELTFILDGVEYIVKRTKDPSNLFLTVNGENKSGKGIKDTTKILSDYLPDITAQLIGSVIVLGQGLPMRFTNNTPAGRKEVLEKLSKSDFLIDDLKERVSNRRSELIKKQREIDDSNLTCMTLINSKNIDINRYTSELEAEKNINYDEIIRDKKKILDDCSKFVSDVSSVVSELNENLTKQQEELTKTTQERYKEISDISSDYDPKIRDIYTDISESKSKEAVLKNKITSIESIKTTCPTCGQKLVGVDKPDVTPIKDELAKQKEITDKLSKELDVLTSEKTFKTSQIASKYAADEKTFNDKIREIKNNIFTNKSKLDECDRDRISAENSLKSAEVSKQNHDYKVKSLESSIESAKDEIEKNKELIQLNQEKINDINLRLDAVSKFENVLKREFRGILLGNVIKYINDRAKSYSNIVFGTDKLDFALNGNNISISYCNKEYENLSGGEKQRVDLIIQFALRDMLCNFLNFSSNILVLDEIVDNLDSIGCQKVMELISSQLNDVGSIYIISHHADIPMPSDYELVITKDKNGISHIKE